MTLGLLRDPMGPKIWPTRAYRGPTWTSRSTHQPPSDHSCRPTDDLWSPQGGIPDRQIVPSLPALHCQRINGTQWPQWPGSYGKVYSMPQEDHRRHPQATGDRLHLPQPHVGTASRPPDPEGSAKPQHWRRLAHYTSALRPQRITSLYPARSGTSSTPSPTNGRPWKPSKRPCSARCASSRPQWLPRRNSLLPCSTLRTLQHLARRPRCSLSLQAALRKPRVLRPACLYKCNLYASVARGRWVQLLFSGRQRFAGKIQTPEFFHNAHCDWPQCTVVHRGGCSHMRGASQRTVGGCLTTLLYRATSQPCRLYQHADTPVAYMPA